MSATEYLNDKKKKNNSEKRKVTININNKENK